MPDDKLIADAEEAELDAHRAARAANLFDVRRFIGGLFAIYGVILSVLGIGASDADVEKAAGVNVNLWTGLAMLLVAALFLAWAFTRPAAAEELEEAESERGGRRVPGATRRRHPPGGVAPGAEQRQHRAAEAAADHARAGGAGVLERLDRALDLGHGRLVVVAQARRARRRAARRRARGRRRRAPRPSRRRARSRSGRGARGGPAAPAARRRDVGVAQAGDRRAPRRPRAHSARRSL